MFSNLEEDIFQRVKMEFLEYCKKVKQMNLPFGKYAILGSGPLAIRGIRDSKDIDLIVTQDIFEVYKNKPGWNIKHFYEKDFLEKDGIELWNKIGPGEWNIEKLIKKAEIIDGLPIVNLKDFIKWKQSAGREKDMIDVELAKNIP